MGVYIYTTAPKRFLTAEVVDASGERKTIDIAIYDYAARMSLGEPSRYERLAIGSATSRFDRAGVKPLAFGMYGDAKTRTIDFNGGHNDVLDVAGTVDAGGGVFYDSTIRGAHLRIARIVKLPKGWRANDVKQAFYNRVLAGEMITSTQCKNYSGMLDFSLWNNGKEFVMVAQGGESHALSVAHTNAERLWAHWEGFRETRLSIASQQNAERAT